MWSYVVLGLGLMTFGAGLMFLLAALKYQQEATESLEKSKQLRQDSLGTLDDCRAILQEWAGQ